MPEVIEEVLHCAADAAMIIGRAQNKYIRRHNALFQRRKTGLFVGAIRIVKGQCGGPQVEDVHGTTGGAEQVSKIEDHDARNRSFVQAAGDCQHLRFRVKHGTRLARVNAEVERAFHDRRLNKNRKMTRKRIQFLRPHRWPLWVGLAGAFAMALAVSAADLTLPTLRTKYGTYTNVVVTGRSATDIFIRHAGGLGNVKLADIRDDEALVALGIKSAPPKVVETPAASQLPAVSNQPPATSSVPATVLAAVQQPEARQAAFEQVKKLIPSGSVLAATLGAMFVFYLFA